MNPLTKLFGAMTGGPAQRTSLDLERLEERVLLSWTFMVYVDGDNNLEDAAIDDFLEMSSVGSSADVNVVVQMDRTPGYDARYGNWTDTRRGLAEGGDVPNASWGTSMGELNMGDPNTLLTFANWAVGAYPADDYALVLWDHGGGWRSAGAGSRDCCWDDTSGGDYLANNEVRFALEGIAPNIDLLGFDACLMAMIETAYEVRGEASIFVGSEDTEPWDGWPYDTILPNLMAQPTMDAASLGALIADRYYQSYGTGQWVTQSATDLSALVAPGGLADSVSDLAATIMSTANASDYTALQGHRYDSAWYLDGWDPYFIDLGDFLTGLAGDATITSTIRSAAATALTAYNSTIITSYADPGWGTGLSIYFQDPGVSPDWAYNGSTIDFPADTQWDEFLAWWEDGPSATGGSISGSKWEDTDGDGTWDTGEPGLSGWTIFLDQNQNGVLDGGEASTTTGSYGSYAFSGLSAGTYHVAEVLQSGWEQTFPTGGTHTVLLSAGESATGLNFGNQVTGAVNEPPVLTTVNTLTGASEDLPFSITYLMMANAADESDPDGDTVSFRVESLASKTLTEGGVPVIPGTSLLEPGETWVWQGPANANGLLNAFTVRAWDGQLASAADVQVRVQVVPVNDAPTLTTVATLTGALVDQDFTITYDALSAAANESDVDSGALSFRVESVTSGTLTEGGAPVIPGTTLLSPGEQLVWHPAAGAAGHVGAFAVVAWDGLAASAPNVQVTVSVNNAPTLTAIDTLPGVQEDTQFSITYTILANAADEDDLDDDVVSFRLESIGGGVLTEGGLPVVPGQGLLEPGQRWDWTPPLNANGTLGAFTVRAWDGEAASASAVQVRVQVHAVNDAPEMVALADAPDPVTRPAALTLTALGVSDPEGSVVAVEFYRDANANGTFEAGLDLFLGNGAQQGSDWAWTGGTMGWPLGAFTYFARGQDDLGEWGDATSAVGTVQNSLPVASALSDEPDPVYRPGDLTLAASGIADADGVVVRAEFYRDANGNGALDPAADALLGIDLDGADGWSWSGTTAGWPAGGQTYSVRVQDDDAGWSAAASATGTIPNLLPAVGSLDGSPDPVTRPGALTLTAADVQDPDGSVVRVAFYRDANANGTLEPGTDVLLGEDTVGANGWSWFGSTSGWPAEAHTYFARAQDTDGGWSAAVATAGTVQNALPVVGSLTDSPDPVTRPDALTLKAEGAGDVDGSITRAEFYRDANGDGVLNPDLDVLLGADTSAVGGWSWSGSTLGWPLGAQTYFTRVRDNDGDWSSAAATTGAVQNAVPAIASMSDLPDPVTRPAAMTLSAAGVIDQDGQIVRVEFYLDTNRNGSLQIGSDAFLGEDTQGANGWTWSGSVALWALGTYGAFARVQDNDGAWSPAVSTTLTVQNALPTVGSLAQTPGEVARPGLLALTATGVADPDGSVGRVEFYRDANGNGVLDPAGDLLLGIDADGANGWSWSASTAGWPLGQQTYLARAHDNDGAWGVAASATGAVRNALPTIAALVDSPDPVMRSGALTLAAQGVADPDGSVTTVEFYRDADGNGVLNPGVDTLLGTDANGADGWSWSGSTLGWALGAHAYLARARDNDSAWSAVSVAMGSVQNAPPAVALLTASPGLVGVGQTLTLTAGGVADADGAVTRVEFYLDSDGVPGLDPATDEFVGAGQYLGGGAWKLALDTRGWALGSYAYIARAKDNDGGWSAGTGAEVQVSYSLIESRVVDRATISFYDVDASNGVISPEVIEWSPLHYGLSSSTAVFVNLGYFGDGVIDSILLLGNGSVTADLGIVVEDNMALGAVVDARMAPQPLQFLVSEGYVGSLSLLSGMAGGYLNGFTTEAGWTLAPDVDGDGDTDDRTALYTEGRLNVAIARGSVQGDVVAHGNLGYLQVNGGDLNGDVVLTASDVGTIVTVNGDIAGSVMAPAGAIGSLIAVNGNIDLSGGGQIRARSSIGAVQALGGSILGGGGGGISVDNGHLAYLYASGDLTADVTAHGNLGTVGVGGSIRNARIWADGALNTLYALGDFHNANVRAGRLGVVYVGGRITEDSSDGEDEIRALEAQFFVMDSGKSAWITPGSPDEFGGVAAWVG